MRENNSTNFYFNVGTHNVRGISSTTKQQQLFQDFESYKLSVLCLQETKISNGADWTSGQGHRTILFDTECRHYGNGFIVNKSLTPFLQKAWKLSDRVCAIQIGFNFVDKESKGRTKSITIINVYAPTSTLAKSNPEERDKIYLDLQNLLDSLSNDTLILIAGDLNSKIGKKINNEEDYLGSYSRGHRNENGEYLADFLDRNALFLTNTAFQKAARHITTWVGTRQGQHGKVTKIYNQIDYIICRQSQKHLITNSRSYGGTLVTSDHKLVKTEFRLTPHNIRKPQKAETGTVKRNRQQLQFDKECRSKYQAQLNAILTSNEHYNEKAASEQWEHLKTAITLSVNENVEETSLKRHDKHWDSEIEKLSIAQKELRLKIQNCQEGEKIAELKKERNYILHQIKDKALEIKTKRLDQIADNIDNSTNDGGMFKAVKALNKKNYENPKIEDKDGKLVTNPDEIHRIITEHFKSKFRDENTEDIECFTGEPKALKAPITTKEVKTSIDRLNNGKTPGQDGICNEYLKYAPDIVAEHITSILNQVFEKHEDIGINNGIILALQKPGKPKGPPQNLRPITLLNSIRKVLSTIALKRIQPRVETYLSHSQSGFRPNRSTSDVVWTHRWISAKVIKSKDLEISITGIDMSAAFDTIDRAKLLDTLREIVDEDELRIIQYLLSETTLNVKTNGAQTPRDFKSNIGTPQGDSLSPQLFIVYLENALREVRPLLVENSDTTEKAPDQTPSPKPSFAVPDEIIYADDIDFIGREHKNVEEIGKVLKNHNLKVNVDKTELTTISRDNEEWKKSKKVGSLLGNKEDIKQRKHLSSVALNKLSNVWCRSAKIKLETRLKLYNSLVKSILLYNSATWSLTKSEENSLDAFQRKQLRRVLDIHYPTIITNRKLYKKCKETPISLQIMEQRWRLFGHILRRDREIPANKAMEFYFSNVGKRARGRPTTTLPVTLDCDLKHINDNTLRLKTNVDLENLRDTAQNRIEWKALTKMMRKTAEAAKSEDLISGRP